MSQAPRRGPAIPSRSGAKPAGSFRPAGAPGPSRAPRPLPAASGSGGALSLILLLLMLGGMLFCYTLAFTSNPSGARIPPSGSSVPNMRNLLAVGLSSGRNLTITEAEINGYLAATLKARQGGPLSSQGALRSVAVRLRDGDFQVILVRSLFGREHAVSVDLSPSLVTSGGQQSWTVQPTGGRIGKLPITGQLTKLIIKPVLQLASIYPDEMKILRQASSIRVELGRVLLGPVVPKS